MRARDVTRLEPLGMFFPSFLNCTNACLKVLVQRQAAQRVETAMTAAEVATAGARDISRLEPLVSFYFFGFLFSTLMFILV
jgi:hypothetical protein